MTKRLYRSAREKMLGGVAGGLAEYFEVDVTLVRLILLVTMAAGGLGFFAYIIAWVIIPLNPEERPLSMRRDEYPREAGEEPNSKLMEYDEAERQSRREKNRHLAGIVLIGLGVMFFMDRFFTWFRWDRMWPLLLIGIGVLILFRGSNGGKKG